MSIKGSALLPYNDKEIMLAKFINQARTDPKSIAELLEQDYKPFYKGKLLKLPGQRVAIETWEGISACNEAISFLKSVKPVEELSLSRALSLAAKKAVNEYGRAGKKQPEININEYGYLHPLTGSAELVSYNDNSAEKFTLFSLLICDGEKERLNREDIFSNKWKMFGVAVGKHKSKEYEKMSLVVFASQCYDSQDVSVRPLHDKYKNMWTVNEIN